MGSMSTNLKCKVGGFEGRKLKSGDVLPLRYPQSDLYGMTSRVFEPEKQKDGTVTVHVIPGPQDDYFSDKGKNIFYSETYSVTGDSDRMGIKLDGTPVESVDGVDIISDGIVARLGSDSVLRQADNHDGGQTDYRRLCKDSHGHYL